MIRVTSLQSADVRVQKKLAARRPRRWSKPEKVDAIVVLPVPAMPFIQYTPGPSALFAHSFSSSRTLVRVPSVHVRLLMNVARLES
jgi:hypothetical protein